MPELSAAALAYVRFVLEETKLSPSGLAKKAKISSTTLTRALNDPKHKFALSVKTLEKIADASGIDPAGFLHADDSAALSAVPIYRPRVYNEKKWGETRDYAEEGRTFTMIAGTVLAGVWQELSVLSINRAEPLDVTIGRFQPEQCFTVLVGDDSVNAYARRNEILYCARVDALFKSDLPEIRHRLAIVERRSKDGFHFELTARMVTAVRPDEFAIHFTSYNKKWSAKDVTTVRDLSGPDLKVIGLVEWILRVPPGGDEGRGTATLPDFHGE